MIKDLNQKIQKHFAFFGPIWFCWFLVFLGFLVWIVEPSLKTLGYREYGPLYNLIEIGFEALKAKQYFWFFVIACILSFWMMCLIIYFPSFWVLLTNTFIFKYGPQIKFKYMASFYIYYALVLLIPFWYHYFLNAIVRFIQN